MEQKVDDGKVQGEEEKGGEQGGNGTRSPCFSLDTAWGKPDKQADRRKWSSLCIWMARANVQKAREEARSHSLFLHPGVWSS